MLITNGFLNKSSKVTSLCTKLDEFLLATPKVVTKVLTSALRVFVFSRNNPMRSRNFIAYSDVRR